MKRILQIAATSIALLLVFAVAIPAFAASTCPTANTSPVNNCLAKYKLTASDISSIQEALKACGLSTDVLRYVGITGSTPDEQLNPGSTPDEQLNFCTEADCANNGCDAADCGTAGCKDTCADTKCIPPVEEEPADTATEAVVPAETKDDADVKAAATEKTGNAAIDEAIIKAKEAVKNYTSSSNCPQTDDGSDQVAGVVIVPQQGSESANCPTSGSSDVKSQLQDAVNKALEQAKSQASSNSNCPTSGSDTRAQIQDALSNALNQARSNSSGSNCPTGSGSVDVNGILNQLQNSGLSNCNR